MSGPLSLTRQQIVFTFVGSLLGLFLGALDQTVVAAAAPDIARDLGIAPAWYVWVATSYMLFSTVLVPVWGKLSDLYGRRTIIIAGISLFLFASVLCGLAQDTWQLVAARALQGAGSASLFTTAFAVVADMFPPTERGKYSGIFGGVFALSSLVGPPLGGWVSQQLSWHWVFFINLPVGAVALFFIITRMPPLMRPQAVAPRVDWVGAGLLALGVGPMLVAMTVTRAAHSETGGVALPAGAEASLWIGAVVFLAAFFAWERSRAQPLIDLTLFKGRVFTLGNAAVFVLGGVFMAPITFLPLYLVRVHQVSQSTAGLAMVPMVLAVLLGNVSSGQVASRLGRYKAPMLFGLGMLMVGLSVMAFTLSDDATRAEVTWKTVLVGLGLGPSIPLYTVAIQNAIPVQQMGSATSMATFFRQMGGTVGVTVAGVVFAASFDSASLAQRHVVEARAQGARVLVSRALDGDQAAAALARQQPWADAQAQALLSSSGPLATVRRALAGSADLARAEQAALHHARATLFEKIDAGQVRELDRARYSSAFRAVYRFALGMAVLALLLTLVLPSLPLRKAAPSGGGSATAAPPGEPSTP